MPVDKSGVYFYTQNDTVNDWPSFLNLAMSSISNALNEIRLRLVYTVSNQTDMVNKKNAVVAQGVEPNSFQPLLFLRMDNNKFYKWDGSSFNVVE